MPSTVTALEALPALAPSPDTLAVPSLQQPVPEAAALSTADDEVAAQQVAAAGLLRVASIAVLAEQSGYQPAPEAVTSPVPVMAALPAVAPSPDTL